MNFIKNYIQNRRKKDEATKDARLKAEFEVTEKNGMLWLTHDGRAFARIEDGKTADEISRLLSEARIAAITFERI